MTFFDLTIAGQVIKDPENFKNPGNLAGLVTSLVPYAMALGTITMFLLFIYGGFLLLTSVGTPDKVAQGKGVMTGAVIGFVIMWGAYWIVQIVSLVFGLNLVS